MQHSSPSTNFAIIIPAYNEEATIYDIALRALKYSSLVIVIDDGSTDQTIAKLGDLPVVLIENKVNQGKAASLWKGIQAARQHNVEYIISIDGDGQHAPEDIPSLLKKAEAMPEHIIIGARLADKSAIPAKRYYANRIANFWIAWAAGYPISDTQSGFRVYPADLFNDLNISISKQNSFVFESEIIIKAAQRNIRCTSVAIPAVYAENARPSHFNGVRDITYITLMVGRSLFSRGFYPKGLYNSCIKPHMLPQEDERSDIDGYLMLMLSIVIIGLTAGLTLLLSFSYVLLTAITSRTSASKNNIVVLGHKLRNNLPEYDFLQRLNRTLDIAESFPDKSIYIVGGLTGDNEVSEAKAGESFLKAHKLPSKNIYLEQSSRNTLENLKLLRGKLLDNKTPESQQLNDSQSLEKLHISLITNRYHLARAATMANGFGFTVELCAAENTYSPGFISLLKILSESFLLHWYFSGLIFATITRNHKMLSRIH